MDDDEPFYNDEDVYFQDEDQDRDNEDEGDYVEYSEDEPDEPEDEPEEELNLVTGFKDIERTGAGTVKTRFDKIFETKQDAYTTRIYIILKEEMNMDVGDINEFIQNSIHTVFNYQHKNPYILVAALQYRSEFGPKIEKSHLTNILNKKVFQDKVNILDLIRYIRMLNYRLPITKTKKKKR